MPRKNLKGDAQEALTATQAATMNFITSAPQNPVKAAMPSRETKSKRIQVLLRPSVYDALKEKAEARGQSVNDLINDILKENV